MIPKRLWLVFDFDDPYTVLDYFPTRRQARAACKTFNNLQGYEPSCRVAAFDRATPKRSNDTR